MEGQKGFNKCILRKEYISFIEGLYYMAKHSDVFLSFNSGIIMKSTDWKVPKIFKCFESKKLENY